VYVDGALFKEVDEAVVVRLGLHEGMQIDAEQLAQVAAEEEEVVEAQRAALRWLERRSRSRADLERRLKNKGYKTDVVDRVLQRLTELGLIDDVCHAQLLLDSLLKRNLGYYGLVERLRRDGIAAELARQLVSERLAEDVEAQHARQLIDRLAGKWESLPARQRYRKMYDYLRRRGFRDDVISDVLAAGADD